MIIFLKGVLNVLDYFIDSMAKGVEDAYVLDISEPTFFQSIVNLEYKIDETTDVIMFNNVGINLVTTAGENYWELKKVKLHNIYVDAPIWYRRELEQNLQCMQVITVDRYHKEFINAYFPNCRSVRFLPHGGVKPTDREEIAFENRKIEVLYVGSRQSSKWEDRMISLSDSDRELFGMIKDILIKYPYLTLEKVYDLCMDEMGIRLQREAALDVINALYVEVLRDVRGYYQGKVIEALAGGGVHIDIYNSYGWGEIEDKYPNYVHVHEAVEPDECIRLMCESKITLNILPWFKYGAHERIYNAMLNGAVCVSDTSEYLMKHFENGKNIVFYELDKLGDLVKNVRMVLDNPGFARHIIENQKNKVKNSTWRDRLDNILEQKFEEGVDFI